MSGFVLKSLEFRREREGSWGDLDDLVTKVETGGIRALSVDELVSLPTLYRAALSSLSVARAISLDRNVVEYLEGLCGRAYPAVYSTRQRFLPAIGDFIWRRVPRAVRAVRWFVFASAFVMTLGGIVGYELTIADPDRYHAFVPEAMSQGRNPEAATSTLRAALYDDGGGAGDALMNFAAALFTHNAQIGLLCFVSGFALGLPVILLLLYNGLVLGAFVALYASRGLGYELWAWLLPHGITELLAVILCGAAGLAIGHSLVFPGRFKRLDNLARRGRTVGVVVLGCVGMFLVAGLIEGIFRQSVQSVPVRYSLALLTGAFWLYYFTFAGRSEVSR